MCGPFSCIVIPYGLFCVRHLYVLGPTERETVCGSLVRPTGIDDFQTKTTEGRDSTVDQRSDSGCPICFSRLAATAPLRRLGFIRLAKPKRKPSAGRRLCPVWPGQRAPSVLRLRLQRYIPLISRDRPSGTVHLFDSLDLFGALYP